MYKIAKFVINDHVFDFTNSASGLEEFEIDGDVLSSKKSLSGENHQFEYDGKSYDVQVKTGMSGISFVIKIDGEEVECEQSLEENKLSQAAIVMCYWPLVLVVFGGVVGGGCGGLAAAGNHAIYNSRMPLGFKILLNIIGGCSAFLAWFFVVKMYAK